MRRWITTIALALVLLMAVAVPRADAASKTLYVGTCAGTPQYSTIQSAVDAITGRGYTIYVCPGAYTESVTVQNKEALTIRNYVVKNQSAPLIGGTSSVGFYIFKSEKVTIRGLRIADAFVGISAVHSPQTEVRDTIISARSEGIIFSDSDKSEAQFNTLSGGDDSAIGFSTSTSVTIKNNTITSFKYGIYGISVDKPKIESNTVSNSGQTGIHLALVTRASVRKNTTNVGVFGIKLISSTSTTVSDNTAKNTSQAGVYVYSDSTANTFKNNLLQGNGIDAVDLTTGSKTAGTANTWSSNTCDTSTPAGLCSSAATQRQAP